MSTSPALPEELLLDYAAGACSSAMELLVATHISMTPNSQKLCCMLEDMGGVLLETAEGERLERVTAQSVLAKADSTPLADMAAISSVDQQTNAYGGTISRAHAKFGGEPPPSTLLAYGSDFADEKAWQRLGTSVAAVQLSLSDLAERAHLLWARPGAEIATHRHIGREVVLVLKGAFWDDGIRYGPGDIAVGEDGTIHTPRIDDEHECVCLAVTEAPVQFVGSFSWLLNRFCRF